MFGEDKKIQRKDTFFHNANSAFLRETWRKYPFNPSVTNIEDRIWGQEVISAGLKVFMSQSLLFITIMVFIRMPMRSEQKKLSRSGK